MNKKHPEFIKKTIKHAVSVIHGEEAEYLMSKYNLYILEAGGDKMTRTEAYKLCQEYATVINCTESIKVLEAVAIVIYERDKELNHYDSLYMTCEGYFKKQEQEADINRSAVDLFELAGFLLADGLYSDFYVYLSTRSKINSSHSKYSKEKYTNRLSVNTINRFIKEEEARINDLGIEFAV